jgi:CRISPR-associated protein Cmr3
MNDALQHWRFDPLDTWFFREARGFDTSGSNELSSLFPPPARTVAGAIRTLIGDQQGVDWTRFSAPDEYADLKALIGIGDDLGALQLTGPYPIWIDQRLYPAPLHLLEKDGEYRFLAPVEGDEPVVCDLGKVRLPSVINPNQRPLPGAKPLENAWLSAENLQRVLRGEPPTAVIHEQDLYAEEARLGIARNNRQRTGIDGLLYQTRHLRPRAGLAIGVGVQGLPADALLAPGMARFGGESRASTITPLAAAPALPSAPKVTGHRLLLMLLTPADFGRDWFPPGFTAAERDGVRVWRGEINGVALIIECAVIGKPSREGGWDLATEQPRPVKSLIPAGSVYFCTVAGDAPAAARALQGQRIGHQRALGRGELAIGTW